MQNPFEQFKLLRAAPYAQPTLRQQSNAHRETAAPEQEDLFTKHYRTKSAGPIRRQQPASLGRRYRVRARIERQILKTLRSTTPKREAVKLRS
jgi:hypothetical protein